MKAPVDGRDRACPPCDATGRLLTFEPLDGMAVIVEQPCPTCDATGWITEEQLKAYWRSFYRARAKALDPVKIYDLGELDAIEEARADAAEDAAREAMSDA